MVRLTCITLNVLIVAILTLLSIQPALAQDDGPHVFCGDLSETDCDLLRSSKQAMLNLHSLEINSETVYDLTDVPPFVIDGEPLGLDAARVRILYDTVYSLDDEASRLLGVLGEMNNNVATLALLVSPESALRILAGINAEVKLTVELSDPLVAWLTEQSHDEIPAEMKFTLRLVDSTLYVNLHEIESWAGESSLPGDPEWVAIDLEDLYQRMRREPESSSSFVFAGMIGALAQARSGNTLVELYEDLQKLGELDSELAPGELITIERAPDRRQRGQLYAEYVTHIDAKAALTWLIHILDRFAKQFENDLGPEFSMILLGVPTLAEDMNFENVEMIDPESGLVQRQEGDFSWDMTMLTNLIGLAQSMGDSPVSLEGQAQSGPFLQVSSTVEYSNHDEATQVEAPDDAFAPPLDELYR